MRWFFSILLFATLFLPTMALADAKTGECLDKTKLTTKEEVGIFLSGMCQECWDQGNCSIKDFLTLIANVGNFILSIIAGLVFLIYIMGGFFWIIAHGEKDLVTKGKKWIKNATIGLVIVLFAWTGVTALQSSLTGNIFSATEGGYYICDGSDASIGKTCLLNSTCTKSGCQSICEQQNNEIITTETSPGWECKYTSDGAGCVPDQCPGDKNNQCCPKSK